MKELVLGTVYRLTTQAQDSRGIVNSLYQYMFIRLASFNRVQNYGITVVTIFIYTYAYRFDYSMIDIHICVCWFLATVF